MLPIHIELTCGIMKRQLPGVADYSLPCVEKALRTPGLVDTVPVGIATWVTIAIVVHVVISKACC